MDYYDATAGGYNELHGEEQAEKLTIIKKFIPLHGSLLDVGCGSGLSLKPFIKKRFCVGIDPSIEMLKLFTGYKVQGKSEALPFQDKSFDVVLSVTTLHLSEMDLSLPELERVARKFIVISLLKKSKSITHSLLQSYTRYDCARDFLFVKKLT